MDHGHGHGRPMTEEEIRAMLEAPAWDERYGGAELVWSGFPNPQLVAEIDDVAPGAALDVGAGEGADAVWLARRGWAVTAVDFSATALKRVAEHAAEAGVQVTTEQADVRSWTPPERAFQLVNSQFMHQPAEVFAPLVARLAAAVAPGGHLLVVGHHPKDLENPEIGRPAVGDMLFTAEEIAARLDPADWEIVAALTRPRQLIGVNGEPVTGHDAVLHARRRA
ncbi:class I SAM-dependent methyltransferase [Pseudonocardia kujensis]|uniref:class I SAM-dependent methyltransferase n=1 Tax=Pseudonocardia kujensis TaxID=1128675 RepID=UPI001E36622F|nr:class I SAM-dependent methyltransferase [Pseudonocardia kujensis]MCE0766042.1 class I SAM-dependent methyltransferase [Pseudonocardia kujensis]